MLRLGRPMRRAAICARYSSDLQNPRSIDDQPISAAPVAPARADLR